MKEDQMSQKFLNSHLPWQLVAIVNFTTMMVLCFCISKIGSRWISWLVFDPIYMGAGSYFYAYFEFKDRKKYSITKESHSEPNCPKK